MFQKPPSLVKLDWLQRVVGTCYQPLKIWVFNINQSLIIQRYCFLDKYGVVIQNYWTLRIANEMFEFLWKSPAPEVLFLFELGDFLYLQVPLMERFGVGLHIKNIKQLFPIFAEGAILRTPCCYNSGIVLPFTSPAYPKWVATIIPITGWLVPPKRNYFNVL
jgi:hypothetical protein